MSESESGEEYEVDQILDDKIEGWYPVILDLEVPNAFSFQMEKKCT